MKRKKNQSPVKKQNMEVLVLDSGYQPAPAAKKGKDFRACWSFLALLFMVLPGRWTVYVSVFMIGGYIGGSGNIMGAMTTTVFGRYDFSRAFSVIYPMCVAVRSCAYTLVGTLSTATGGYFVPYLVLMGVAVLGMRYFREGKYETAAEHAPDYLRPSQAERERAEKEHA